MRNRIESLDGLRAVSIALVLCDHAALTVWGTHHPDTGLFLALGDFGVQVFFVLSGFLITGLLWEGRNGGLKAFYFRRAFRILPAAVAYLAAVIALQLAGVIAGTGRWEILAALFFFRNFAPGQYYTDHYWSLSVEEQFYILWPLLALRLPPRILIALLLALLSAGFCGAMLSASWAAHAVPYGAILTGCLLAILLRRQPSRAWLLSARLQSPLLFSALIAGLAGSLFAGWTGPTAYLARGLAIALVVNFLAHGERRPSIADAFFRARPVTFVGRISYSLYLWQQLFWGTDPRPFQKMPWGLALAFLAAVASYYVIESPARRWRDRRQGKPDWRERPETLAA